MMLAVEGLQEATKEGLAATLQPLSCNFLKHNAVSPALNIKRTQHFAYTVYLCFI
jgi:hypothetical protein